MPLPSSCQREPAQVLRSGLARRGHGDGVRAEPRGHVDDVVQPADRHAGRRGDAGAVGRGHAGADDVEAGVVLAAQPVGQLQDRSPAPDDDDALGAAPAGPQPAEVAARGVPPRQRGHGEARADTR